MFQLYDHTRRRIGLTAFFLLCVAPTAAVLGWCIAWNLPSHLRAEAERLSQQFGLEVSLDGLRHPRPGVVVYDGLKLSDPETGQVVLRCRAVEATWTRMTDPEGQRRLAVVVVASQPEIESAAKDRLWQVVERALQRPGGPRQVELRASAAALTLRAGEDSQTFSEVEAGIGALPGGVQAEATFHLAGAGSPKPVRLRVVRNRQITPPANGFELNTGGAEVPCQLLTLGLRALDSLGPASRFRGTVWANQSSAGWEGEVTGQLRGVDLDSLVSEQFPHKLSGTADVTIQQARFCRGRLEQAAGTLSAGPGVIGRSLVDAAAMHLRLAAADGAPATDFFPYEQLALAFQIESRGLKLEGRCAKTGAVLADRRGWLLAATNPQAQPMVALIQTLVPVSQVQVPATRQTEWLARHLPVPEILPSATAQRASPHAQLRLHQEQPR